jgi:putative Mg2+ transporter-C (MgtC) family protein
MHLWAGDWVLQIEIAAKVAIAAALGAVVGMEREISKRPAGLRTHALLAAAAALLVALAKPLVDFFGSTDLDAALRSDPLRIVEAIVTGVSFIGAGTIFRHRSGNIVEGLTTAASLLLVAAIAVAVATGELLLAILVTLLSLAVLRALRRWERH